MKLFVLCLFVCASIAVLIAGCTTLPPTTPGTTVPTTMPVFTSVSTSPVTDPALAGTWYLNAMTGPGGSNPIQTIGVQINAIFTSQGSLSGYGGCNDYSTQYTLTGEDLPNGKGIAIGPIITTLKYCEGSSNTEGTYLQILQNATSYSASANQLSITSRTGSILLFEKTAYGPTAVPIGV
jgi:heat shock protein HslJ